MRRVIPALLAGGVLLASGSAHAMPAASQFTVVVTAAPTPVTEHSPAILQVHTRIGATCTARIIYTLAGGGIALGGPRQHIGGTGIYRWHWSATIAPAYIRASVRCSWKGTVRTGSVQLLVEPPPAPTAPPAPPTTTPGPQPPPPPAQPTQAAAGTSPSLPGIEVSATDLRSDDGGDSPPPAGSQFVVVRVTIVNSGTDNYEYNPLDFYLQDGGDQVQHNGDALDTNILDSALNVGTLAPGEQVTGDIAYQVPASETEFRLWWQPAFDVPYVAVPVS